MPRKQLIILSLLVIVPLLAFLLLGRRLMQAEQARTRSQFEELLEANLAGIDRSISEYFNTLEQRLLLEDIDADDVESIRKFARAEPLVEQVLVLDPKGRLEYPDPNTQLNQRETSYLLKVERLIEDRSLSRQHTAERSLSQLQSATEFEVPLDNRPFKFLVNAEPSTPHANSGPAQHSADDHGWYTWYWGGGIQLLHWQALDDNRTLVIGLQRSRWMADVIAMLPDSNPENQNRTAPAQIRLVDADGDTVYLWGANRGVPEDAEPVVSLHSRSPLRPWRLQHFGPSKPFSLGTSATLINLIATGGVLSVGLLVLATYLSREIGRQTREARQRVNFVNQVSHELKTPLTNIRMYADLLEQDLERLDPDDEKSQSHLKVITSESSRLSRLINNVLTFARLNRNAQPKPQVGCVDEVIDNVVAQFRPALDKLGIEVQLDLNASSQVTVDLDALEQVLGNLIGNVEKYAAAGKHLRIASHLKLGVSTVDVWDAGPGISPAFAKRLFTPFERASDQIVSATGTGIGLAISRGLARRNGGDLVLRESAMGASFRLTLPTPLWDGKS